MQLEIQLHHPLQITQKQTVTEKEIQQQDKRVSVSRSLGTSNQKKVIRKTMVGPICKGGLNYGEFFRRGKIAHYRLGKSK